MSSVNLEQLPCLPKQNNKMGNNYLCSVKSVTGHPLTILEDKIRRVRGKIAKVTA